MVAQLRRYILIFLLAILTGCTESQMASSSETQLATSPSIATSYPANSTPTILLPTSTAASPSPSLAPSPLPTISPTVFGSSDLVITQLQMFGGKTGWALHEKSISAYSWDAKILWTMDSGKTWKNVSPPTPTGYSNVPSVSFVDADIAIAVYSKSFMPKSLNTEITIRRTTDSGQTWQTGDTIPLNHPPLMRIRQIMMVDSQNGWMLGEGGAAMGKSSITLFATQDGGYHWEVVYDSDTNFQANGNDLHTLWGYSNYPYGEQAFTFTTLTRGFYSNGDLFVSQDGGKSWQVQPLPSPIDWPDLDAKASKNALWPTTSQPKFVSAQDGVLLRRVYSRDQVTIPPGSYAGLPKGQYLYFTHDGGQTWSPDPSPVKIGTVYFHNPQTGWFLGKDDADPSTSTQLYQTIDGGKTWAQIAADCLLPLGSVMQFVDEKTGFAFTPAWTGASYGELDRRSGTVSNLFTTTDGGQTWEQVTPQLTP
jgi:photosystem II stability/assembly factor-like uncharacterized protein